MPVGPLELGIILVIIIIIFGVGKLPEIGGALGRGIREFRETARDDEDEHEEEKSAGTVESSQTSQSNTTTNTTTNEPAKEEL